MDCSGRRWELGSLESIVIQKQGAISYDKPRNSGVGPGDAVLEFEPDSINLTMKLLEVAYKVVVVEVDNCMPRMKIQNLLQIRSNLMWE
ncbi:hypothetical protein L2E82_13726 [Cichorium intybus]|uniref:Uncharacterized protein n=1 Tax=Cichorium intybus TaxID=13427 RepID=A0ACB9EYE0_CICIN|nr:hypothetical protein L2E82_13726 [Cichorium intybus]